MSLGRKNGPQLSGRKRSPPITKLRKGTACRIKASPGVANGCVRGNIFNANSSALAGGALAMKNSYGGVPLARSGIKEGSS